MRRTQIYLGDEQVARLKSAARAGHRTVSEIIREAIEEKLARPAHAEEFEQALRASEGLWSDRNDLGSTDEYVRRLRRDRRGSNP